MHEAPSVYGKAFGASQKPAGWREVLEQRHAALLEEMGNAVQFEVASEIAAAVAKAVAEAGRDSGQRDTEALHQALRRLRQPAENREILKVLNEIAAPWAERSVVVVFENHQAVTVAIRGGEDAAPIVFEIGDAPALAAAIESRDMVIALSSATEISPQLAALFETGAASGRAYLFPLSVRQSVRAIFIAAGSVVTAPVEVLCEAAGMKLELAESGTRAELVSLAPAPARIAEAGPLRLSSNSLASNSLTSTAWNDLNTEDQRLHLQAQRMARVRVAGLRLNHHEALRRGEAAHDIYGALAAQIGPARTEFLQTFISKSATMVDYLHLEILANLAHNDEKLLGSSYPGPMV